MKKEVAVFSVFAALAVQGCAKYGNPADEGGGAEPIKNVCPAVKLSNYDRILFHAPSAMPAKIAVVLNGARKYDECAGGPLGAAPVVTLERGKNGTAVVQVVHDDADPTLPTRLSFDVLRLDCSGRETLFYRATDVALKYAEEKPYGPACGGAFSAKEELP